MYNKDFLQYSIDEIKKAKNKPYIMHSEKLADEIFSSLIIEFPEMQIVK